MECRVCGRKIANEEAHFCEYCGASLRENTVPETPVSPYTGQNGTYNVSAAGQNPNAYENTQIPGMKRQPAADMNSGMESPITFKGWIGIMLLPFIPMIGTFIYFAILFTWAFGSNASQTRKGWARATLLVLLVSAVLLMAMMPSVMGGILK